MVPENIHTSPTEGIGFSRGEGGESIWLIFQWGGGVHHREIFPEGSSDGFESNKEKTQKFTMTIYLRRWSTPHENRKNDHF